MHKAEDDKVFMNAALEFSFTRFVPVRRSTRHSSAEYRSQHLSFMGSMKEKIENKNFDGKKRPNHASRYFLLHRPIHLLICPTQINHGKIYECILHATTR
jgi:hypothetical protein